MNQNMQIPIPLFDGLQAILNQEDYQPKLNKEFQQDHVHAKNFLLSYRGNIDTFNSYRRDIERFLQWCFFKAKKSVRQIKRAEFEDFLAFCQKPPTTWIATTVEDRFIEDNGKKIPNKKWRPFVVKISKTETKAGGKPNKKNYDLSDKSLKAVFAIVSSFYNFLLQEEYTLINPTLLIRQKSKYFRKQQTATPIRRLSELQWGYVIETAEIMARENREQYARTLFIMNALYGMYLRISELVASKRWSPTMGNFYRDADGLWWFLTVGKGNKERRISVSNAMLNALKEYRKSLNLTPLPSPNEKTPLFTAQQTNQPLKNTRYIRVSRSGLF